MNKKILVVIVLAVAVVGGILFFQSSSTQTDTQHVKDIPNDVEALDFASEFYNRWFDAAASASTTPQAAGLLTDAALSPALQQRLADAYTDTPQPELDPVLCQKEVPERIGLKQVSETDELKQFMVITRGTKLPGQALVTVSDMGANWEISKIECSWGETAPEREFSFDREGQLLKSVPPPFDPEYWHLVFEQDGVNGHVVPLFFDENSVCIDTAGAEAACDPNTFTQTATVRVQGDMSEAGLTVQRLTQL